MPSPTNSLFSPSQTLTALQRLMAEFAARTGLSPPHAPGCRYLWTDSFAVCNFLELFRLTGRADDRTQALQLVDQVHFTLGRHRPDDSRTGWISGLSEADAERHPTRGGLRIGKPFPERRPSEPCDERLEWDRDGQYFHYLTRWMHALNRVTVYTGDPKYNRWAIELAQTAHARFTFRPAPGRSPQMYWKMSIDLSRPLVASMGYHDPLDALVTCCRLRATAIQYAQTASAPDLRREISDFAAMCEGQRWVTDDTLGIGGLLSNACELAHLCAEGEPLTSLLQMTLEDSARSLQQCVRFASFERPAATRLAFRELGLSIGLHGVDTMLQLIQDRPGQLQARDVPQSMQLLAEYRSLIEIIESFWLDPVNQESQSWMSHRDINSIMLATSLAPHVYLTPSRAGSNSAAVQNWSRRSISDTQATPGRA